MNYQLNKEAIMLVISNRYEVRHAQFPQCRFKISDTSLCTNCQECEPGGTWTEYCEECEFGAEASVIEDHETAQLRD